MADIVLIHGAWHGGWCWRDVAAALRAAGHRVIAPTLTGMGDREHLGRSDTDLSVHARDIAAAVETEELTAATMVLHSYAALPGSVAADRLGPRVSRVVLLEALWPSPGQSNVGRLDPAILAATEAALVDGFRLPPWPPELFGVPADHPGHAWLRRRLTSLPWAAMIEPLPLLDAAWEALPKHFVVATANALPGPLAAAARAHAAGWSMHELATGHDTMVTAPAETAALIARIAA